MRPVRLALAILLTLAASGAARADEIASETKFGTRWLSVEKGLDEGKRLGKPVLVIAWARWCPACRQMFKDVFGGGASNGFAQEFQKRFVLAEVEVDAPKKATIRYKGASYSGDEFAARFIESPGIPWFTVFGADGEHKGLSFDGGRLPHAMLYFSDPKISSKMSFERFYRENPLR